jgi:hypothetical protein
MVKKHAVAKSNKEILYNLKEEDLYSLSARRPRNTWFVVTTQEHNPPDTRTDIVLIHRIAQRLGCKKEKIGINKDGNITRWVRLF